MTDVKQPLKAGLYLVATPIGNLRDITLRALDVLGGADIIYCEDTRVTGKLLSHYGIKAKTQSYNDHNADARRVQIISAIKEGKVVALVSDAGMPLVSDPGYKLVRDCMDTRLYVTTLPGANAPLAALQLSGLPSDSFTFLGFLPTKAEARRKTLQQWQNASSTLIIFESAKRLQKTLSAIHEIMGNREIAVVREITKMFEETRKSTAENLITYYGDNGTPKGEIVIVINGVSNQTEYSDEQIDRMIRDALEDGMRTKDAAAFIAQKTNHTAKEIYARILDLKDE